MDICNYTPKTPKPREDDLPRWLNFRSLVFEEFTSIISQKVNLVDCVLKALTGWPEFVFRPDKAEVLFIRMAALLLIAGRFARPPSRAVTPASSTEAIESAKIDRRIERTPTKFF